MLTATVTIAAGMTSGAEVAGTTTAAVPIAGMISGVADVIAINRAIGTKVASVNGMWHSAGRTRGRRNVIATRAAAATVAAPDMGEALEALIIPINCQFPGWL